MKKLSPVLIGVVAVVGVLVGCGDGGEEGEGQTERASSPEGTTRAWVEAFAARDSEKLTSLHIVEDRDVQVKAYAARTEKMKSVPEISLANLTVETTFEAAEKAEITAQYEFGFAGRLFPAKVKFRLEKRDGEWLITGLSGAPIEELVEWAEVFVRDEEGNPVSGVEVIIVYTPEGELSGVTDHEGMTVLENVHVGRWPDKFEASKEGYVPAGRGYQPGRFSISLHPVLHVLQFMLEVSPPSPEGIVGEAVFDGDTITSKVGKPINIEALVHWHGDISQQSYDVVLTVNDEFYDSVSVVVPDMSEFRVSTVDAPFSLSFDEKGVYEISANGVSFTIVVE